MDKNEKDVRSKKVEKRKSRVEMLIEESKQEKIDRENCYFD